MSEELEAKVAELQKKLDEAKTAQEKAEERSENAQKVIEQHRSKMSEDAEYKKQSEGKALELATELADAAKALREKNDLLAQVQAELAELKKQGPKPQEQPTRTVKDQIEAIENSLSDEDREALGQAIENAPPDVREAAMASEPTDSQDKLYLELLQALRTANPPPSVPRWQRHTPDEKKSGKANERDLTKLFKQKERAKVWQPSGPDGATPRTSRPAARKPVRKTGWITNAS